MYVCKANAAMSKKQVVTRPDQLNTEEHANPEDMHMIRQTSYFFGIEWNFLQGVRFKYLTRSDEFADELRKRFV